MRTELLLLSMSEIYNRKNFFKKFSELRDIFADIAESSDELAAREKDSKDIAQIPKRAWENLVYVNKTAEEKEEQLSDLLQTDVITTLDLPKLHKIFLAFQRIAGALVELLEQVDKRLHEDVNH